MVRRPEIPEPKEQTPEELYESQPDMTVDFYSDSLHIVTGLYSTILFFGELRDERQPLLRARIKVSPQMLKAISLLTQKHVRNYEETLGPIGLPHQLREAWGLKEEETG